ncbi:MAG: HEAT repeat domain-containing protein [Pirellulales bacterium]|nr:HEAT repeat domain-containing protein [Pirellulales bacterium]
MLRFTSDRWIVPVVCLVILFGGGCADTRNKMRHSWKKTFGYVDDHPNRPAIQSPNERVVELRELGKEAPKRSQEEQEEVSANLAKAIRTELDPFMRAEIVRALANFQTGSATAVLAAGLNDPDSEVRIACCEALGKRGGPASVQALGEALTNDTDINVRLAAARGLGETKDPGAIKPLGVALEENNPAIQLRAVESLRLVSGKEYGNDVESWRAFAAGREPAPYTPTVAERLRNLF